MFGYENYSSDGIEIKYIMGDIIQLFQSRTGFLSAKGDSIQQKYY